MSNSALQEARKKISEQKLQTLKTVLEDMIYNKEEINIPRVCSLTGLSKSFLYKNEKAKALFTEAKQKSSLYDSSVNQEGFVPSGIETSNKFDLLLQYEEVKRKLQDSYILQYQLLSAENKRLKKEIADVELQVNYLKSSPKFSIQFITNDDFATFHIESIDGKRIYNPVGNSIIENLLWGDYVISSTKYNLELEEEYKGITLEKALDGYLLSISDEVKEKILIKIILN